MENIKNVKEENNLQTKENEGDVIKTGRRILDEEDLGTVSGGTSTAGGSLRQDLSSFSLRTVVGLTDLKVPLCLRNGPNGNIIPGAEWKNGESIPVHRSYTQQGWYYAYHKGTGKYGFVNPQYVS